MRLFGKAGLRNPRDIAKERLKLMLIQDRIQVSPGFMEELREALLSSLGKYLDVDREGTELSLEVGENRGKLVASVPIKSVKRRAEHD
jgi:cell division topological specificity factor